MTETVDLSDETLKAYVMGRLGVEETARVTRAAEDDPAVAAEIVLLRDIISAGHKDPGRPAGTEFGWARLSRAIDADGRRLTPRIAPLWQIAAAAVAAVVVWQLTVAPLFNSPSSDQEFYQAAGAASASEFSAHVGFRPQATEAALRAALLHVDADIVSGPSAIGLYQLRFADQAHLDNGLIYLRAQSDLVETVEAD